MKTATAREPSNIASKYVKAAGDQALGEVEAPLAPDAGFTGPATMLASPAGDGPARGGRRGGRGVMETGDAMTADLISRAGAGDANAFRQLTEPHRRELQVHCYRMLGSFQDAEDVLQETLLAAWQGLPGFEGRASIRTWLYRIATNRCLNALRSTKRRPAREWDIPKVEPPEPTRLGEVVWLEPYPDALLEDAIGVPLGPEARYEPTGAIFLAFVTALQLPPARQRRRLIL